nr:MarR family transcriptional regulator [Halocatena marina]
MVNETYSPSSEENQILALLQDGRDSDEPWGRANPLYFRERSSFDKGQVEYALSNLRKAGWITRLNSGLYEFVEDPREDGED